MSTHRTSFAYGRELTTKNLLQALMKLVPVRQSTKDEEEHSQAKQQERGENTRRVPDLACCRRDELSGIEAKKYDEPNGT